MTALPLLFVSSEFRVLLTHDHLLFLLYLYYRLGLLFIFAAFPLKSPFLFVDDLGCALLFEVSKFLLFLGWFGDLRYLQLPLRFLSVSGDF